MQINNPDTTKTTNKILLLPTGQDNTGGLNVQRNKVEITDLNSLIDSSRLAPKPKKVLPIIKTVPYVPQTDSIESPVFNTFTGQFELPKNYQGWNKFSFTPINPTYSKNVKIKQQQPAQKKVLEAKRIITEQEIISQNDQTHKGFTNTDWMLGVILVSFLLFSWINVRFSRFVSAVIGASYNYFSARRLQEEGNIVRNKVFFVMNILFFLNTALIITQWFEYNKIRIFNQNGAILFLIMLGCTILLYSARSLFLLLLDFIFLTKGAFLSYNSTIYIYNKLYGFILLPIIVAIPFVSPKLSFLLLFSGFIIFAILYLMRLFRGIQIGFKNSLSILYLILYLCALEILPMILIYHTIKVYM